MQRCLLPGLEPLVGMKSWGEEMKSKRMTFLTFPDVNQTWPKPKQISSPGGTLRGKYRSPLGSPNTPSLQAGRKKMRSPPQHPWDVSMVPHWTREFEAAECLSPADTPGQTQRSANRHTSPADLDGLWSRSCVVQSTISCALLSSGTPHHHHWSPEHPPPDTSFLSLGLAQITSEESALTSESSFSANKREEIKQCHKNEILH